MLLLVADRRPAAARKERPSPILPSVVVEQFCANGEEREEPCGGEGRWAVRSVAGVEFAGDDRTLIALLWRPDRDAFFVFFAPLRAIAR
ncbi:hypothetical protein MRX96_024880 [Rhipicephalus microplus]